MIFCRFLHFHEKVFALKNLKKQQEEKLTECKNSTKELSLDSAITREEMIT